MKSATSGAGSSASGKPGTGGAGPQPARAWRVAGSLLAYLHGVVVMAEMEARKLRHDPSELVTRAVQPVLWLAVFGQAFGRIRAIPTGGVDYLTFLTPGILAQSLMFVSIFYGLTILWDRDQGILQKYLALPVPRTSFVTGKGLGAAMRATCQAVVILGVALAMGVRLRWSVAGVATSLLAVAAGSILFTTLSILIAIAVKTRERFMGIGQAISMPLFFGSNAIYPSSIMPQWLQVLAAVNPLSHLVSILRETLVAGRAPGVTGDWLFVVAATLVLQVVAGRVYHRLLA